MTVVHPPPLDQHLGLGERVEHLGVEQFVPQLAIETLHVSVLPRAARLDVGRLGAHARDPALHRDGRELRAVVRTNMGRRAPGDEQIGQHVDDTRRPELARHPDGQTLAGELVDHTEQAELAPLPGAVLDEVVGPNVIRTLRAEPDTGAVVEPKPSAPWLPGWDFQPLLPPDPLPL